ncbi:MAG: PLP-dependent aminotransferase family protein [Crenarchaeota archaeon]|nr:PLP-dependent aminotransferase family protein [Thermoproteota archaeon]
MKPGYLSSRCSRIGASEIRELLKLAERPDVISLAGGLPDPRLFPKEEMTEIAKRVLREVGEKALQYSPTKGTAVFLREAADFMERHGVRLSGEDDIIVTSGSQQALYLLGGVLIDEGDYVIVEKPTYPAALGAFKVHGARFLGVRMDDGGMDTHDLERVVKEAVNEGKRVKLIYTIPTGHNPYGTTMDNERRKHLLEVAEKYDLLVVEDDPYGLITFVEKEIDKLKSLDKSGRVIYVQSLSKILSPGMRLAWVAGPKDVIEHMALLKQYVDLHTSTLTQYIAAETLRSRVIERNLDRMRRTYKEKRDVMLETLEEEMPEGVEWTKPIGGFFVFVKLPEGIDTSKMLMKAVEKGVAYVPGSAFFYDRSGANTMRLSYSYPPAEMVREGVKRLTRVVRDELAGR